MMAGSLVLGPVVFRGFEVPECLRFGGKQRLVVHALPGGGRVVDVMGDQDRPVEWCGVFSGPEAALRVRLLEQMRRAGEPVPLAWEAWRYNVVIESFRVEARNPAWIRYWLKACVVEAAETVEPLVDLFTFTIAEAVALGAGDGLDRRIDAASAGLGGDVTGAISAAGTLAQLITARAFLGNVS